MQENENYPSRTEAPLFCLTDLKYQYMEGPEALGGINLEIAPGERIALVGQNGSGKTTLIKQLCGLLLPDDGEVHFNGEQLCDDHLEQSRLEIGLLFQDPDDQLFCHTLIDDVAFGPSHQGLSQDAARRAALQALEQVHLADRIYKAPHLLSFGQKKRAALAGLLAMKPSVLLLDEPTTNLDPGQEQVFLDLLMDFEGTLVCISHDLFFLYELCQRAVVMEKGQIAHDCPMGDLVARRSELRSHGLDFSFRMVTDANGADCAVQTPEPPDSVAGVEPMIELENYNFQYPDGTRALNGVNLRIPAGERTALVGENGAGKTTLLSCLLGLHQGRGAYLFEGEPVTRRRRKYLWKNIGMVFQDSADQLFCPSVGEEVAFGLQQMGLPREEIHRRTEEALSLVRLEGFEKRVPLHMSGGERRRLALASVLAMSPKLLILDEPSAGLDPRGEELLLSILRDLDVTLLLVSHDMFFVNALTRRTVVMHRGTVCQDMSTEAFFKDERLGNLNGLAYAFRGRCNDAILALQHEHEHSHFHEHLHKHSHHFEGEDHDHLHKHGHTHVHRFYHDHPGGKKEHSHKAGRYHDFDHAHGGIHGPHDHDHSGHDDKILTGSEKSKNDGK